MTSTPDMCLNGDAETGVGKTGCLSYYRTITVEALGWRVCSIKRRRDTLCYPVGPVGIEPLTEGLRGGGNRSDWSVTSDQSEILYVLCPVVSGWYVG
jgi:hypothetical protein